MLLANVAQAEDQNIWYDDTVTTSELQWVCKTLSVDSSDIPRGSCNKSTAGIISLVTASVDLKPDTADSCIGHHERLEFRGHEVRMFYKCPAATGDKVLSIDLNDMVRWDASTGKLSLKKS